MEHRFEGLTFMVTGAGTGFGSALSVRAAHEGAARVLIYYRSSAAGAEQTAVRVREAGAEADIVQGDITSWGDIQRMADGAFAAGDIDVMINNVGDMTPDSRHGKRSPRRQSSTCWRWTSNGRC